MPPTVCVQIVFLNLSYLQVVKSTLFLYTVVLEQIKSGKTKGQYYNTNQEHPNRQRILMCSLSYSFEKAFLLKEALKTNSQENFLSHLY